MKSGAGPYKNAFTLIELLVVVSIIAILSALLMPALKAGIAARNESMALSNMRQIGTAFMLYANDNSYALPGRVSSQQDRWPALLAKYLGDVRVYASTFDTQNWILRGLTPAQAISNTANNTSYIMNGYNDLGSFTNSSVSIRLNSFAQTSNIILLGTPDIGSRQYYMDFEEAPNGNENDALNLAAFNGGSNYLFADGSAKFITKAAYNAPAPEGNNGNPLETYGNWLWLVNKNYNIPAIGNGGQ